MPHTMSKAKNSISKTLWKLIDKEPSKREIMALWSYFESQCAYCGTPLAKEDRKAHIDHLEANRAVGRNHISNRVLACNVCNGDEKREMDWQRFLATKCGDDQATYLIRCSKIMEWCEARGTSPNIDAAIVAQVERSIQACNRLLEEEANRIKLMLKTSRGEP